MPGFGVIDGVLSCPFSLISVRIEKFPAIPSSSFGNSRCPARFPLLIWPHGSQSIG